MVTAAMMLIASADLPLPGPPVSSVSLALGMRPGHSQVIGRTLSSLAGLRNAVGTGCGVDMVISAG